MRTLTRQLRKVRTLSRQLLGGTTRMGLRRHSHIHLFLSMIIVILGTHTVGAATPDASTLSLQSYVRKNLSVNEVVQQALLQKKNSEAKQARASDVFQNTLTLQPGLYTREFLSGSGLQFNEQRPSIWGQMTQRLPTGSVLGAETTYFLEDTNPAVGGTNSDYRFYIEQPLWRNSFGSLWRRQTESAEAEVRQMNFSEQVAWIDICLSSSENYINTFLAQEERRLQKEAHEVAQKAKSLAQKAYQQRVLRRLDYLNSQSDYLKVKNDHLRAEAEFQQRFATLKVQAEDEQLAENLLDPTDFFDKIPLVETFSSSTTLRILALQAQVEAQHANYLAEKNRTRSAVDFGAETRRIRSVQPSDIGLLNAQQDITQVYLRLQLPLINKTFKADVATAHNNWDWAEFEKQRQEKLITTQFQQNRTFFKNRSEQLLVAQENVSIKRRQLQEATQLLQVGRIEFMEYVIYRDALLNEEINLLRLRAGLWQLKAQLAQYDETYLKQCKELVL